MEINKNSELNDIEMEFTSEFSEEGYLCVWAGAKLDDTTIGSANLYIFNSNWNDDFLDAADSISADLESVIGTAIHKIEYFDNDYYKVAVLDRISVIKAYRQQGFGAQMLEKIQDYVYKVLEMQAIILLAAPIEEDEEGNELEGSNRKEYIQCLLKFYEGQGFKPFHENYMINKFLDFDYELATGLGHKIEDITIKNIGTDEEVSVLQVKEFSECHLCGKSEFDTPLIEYPYIVRDKGMISICENEDSTASFCFDCIKEDINIE
ncbi:GNAT family N-acetyltransferase [Viridibacillus arvi]|uniref:GNAT family N-acetyltransferase n=1 Tax=Viridibacillus arvi TaxID=263475 RepID=UPI0034CD9062